MRLLLIEDDRGIAEPLVEGLHAHGYEVGWVTTGGEALEDQGGGLVLLDLGLPDLDGTEVCRRLRARDANRPIIVITARGEEDDRVRGLDAGADDYLVKPFGFRELTARIRAVTRRVGGDNAGEDVRVQQLGRLVVDRSAHRVLVDGREVALTPKELQLLAALAERPGRVVNRHVVFERVWGPHFYGPTKTLDVHVASLRRKLGHPEWIETIRNVGLRLGDTGTDGAPDHAPSPRD
ncbi:MAG TPA: response regulator transcription factor [Acidimicrobiales bacterium]|nr:response regulator transcription factor [Acidimicrobiales bacterium]